MSTEGRPTDAVRRLRHILRSRLSEYPALYLPIARRRYPGPSPEVIGPDTELVIDGYTRSASTFAVYAFQLAQDRPVRLAHHLHAPAQLLQAARTGVPALVLIREPKGTVLSQVVREPGVGVRDALVSYTRFYSRLMPWRDRFVVGDFAEVTSDFGAVVRRLNARFGTSYREFQHTEAAARECFELIERRGTLSRTQLGFESGLVSLEEVRREQRDPTGVGTLVDSAQAWVPSAERKGSIAELRQRWYRDDLAPLRDRADRVYRTFLAGSGAGP
jgi:hypothetical protein